MNFSMRSVPSERAILNSKWPLEITDIGKKRHFPPPKKQVEVVGSLGVYLNIFDIYIYIYLYMSFYISSSMHRWRHCSACSKQGQDGPQSKHGTEKRAAAKREHLESVGIFLKICPEKWPARQELLLHLQRSFNNRMPDWVSQKLKKLEKSKSQDHKNYHNTQAFLFEAPALLFIPGWEVFISQLET
jgi:hypothetical protein